MYIGVRAAIIEAQSHCLYLSRGLAVLPHNPLPLGGMAVPVEMLGPFVHRVNGVELRLQAISFFVFALLLCTAIVWGLWNFLRRDLQWLPRLSFGKTLVGVVLWGLMFFIVMAMISGARELMTPGAWKPNGFTYKLNAPAPPVTNAPAAVNAAAGEQLLEPRRKHLEELRQTLWHFAATHDGRFPSGDDLEEIPKDRWQIPGWAGFRYLYANGLKAGDKTGELLAWEPEIERERRWVLLTNGDIVQKSSDEIAELVRSGSKP